MGFVTYILIGFIAGIYFWEHYGKATTEINNNTEIGKMKNKGEGNQQTDLSRTTNNTSKPTAKERRLARREKRRNKKCPSGPCKES